VEEQFYLIIPLALVALVRARISIPWSLGAATLISFTLSMILTGFDQAAAFYLPFTRFWELAVGGLLAYVTLHHREHVARLQHWTLALAGLLIIATAVKITPFSFFPGWWAIPPVLGTTLVIAAGSATALNRILAWRPLVAIGLISYPLYLWHWPLIPRRLPPCPWIYFKRCDWFRVTSSCHVPADREASQKPSASLGFAWWAGRDDCGCNYSCGDCEYKRSALGTESSPAADFSPGATSPIR
jgi:Acyltransferase family